MSKHTVYRVDEVTVVLLKSNPPKLSVTAYGTVPTAGWSKSELPPYVYIMPPADGIHTPLGVDVRRVVETRIVPFITTGVLHESAPTVGQIGTGVARAPVAIFDQALVALAYEWGIPTPLPQPLNTVQIDPAPMPA